MHHTSVPSVVADGGTPQSPDSFSPGILKSKLIYNENQLSQNLQLVSPGTDEVPHQRLFGLFSLVNRQLKVAGMHFFGLSLPVKLHPQT